MDLSALGLKASGYYRCMMSSEYHGALSPQLLDAIRKRESIPVHFPEKSDIFSLGVTMLSAATNIHYAMFYDFDNYRFKYDYVAEKLVEMIGSGYSKLLVGCIGNMLQEKESGRPSVRDLMNFINVNSDVNRRN